MHAESDELLKDKDIIPEKVVLRFLVSRSEGSLRDLLEIFHRLQIPVLYQEWGALDQTGHYQEITITVVTGQLAALLHALKGRQEETGEFRLMAYYDEVSRYHIGGKIEIGSRVPVRDALDLANAYTPGVAKICHAIRHFPELSYEFTSRGNSIYIVTDGSAVLGLGNLGPFAAQPVMEGKSLLFKRYGDVNCFVICLATQEPAEIVRTVVNIAPAVGGINLEDISAPRCFIIERELQRRLSIPVFHDDQHGTAIVVLAAMINAMRVAASHCAPQDLKIVVNGCGAAGVAITRTLLDHGFRNIVQCDLRANPAFDYESWKKAGFRGVESMAITADNEALARPENWHLLNLARLTNPNGEKGTVREVLRGAHAFIGVSGPRVLSKRDILSMQSNAIVFALANPVPEIEPSVIFDPEVKGHIRVFGTGRSDYTNQINNVLAFPGLFRGALEARAAFVNRAMKLAAAEALADSIREKIRGSHVVPKPSHPTVHRLVAEAVKGAYARAVREAEERGLSPRELYLEELEEEERKFPLPPLAPSADSASRL